MNIKFIVAGGRDFNGTSHDWRWLFHQIGINKEDEVVCGGARGGDAFGKEYAEEYGLKVKMFPAEWGKYGRSAGYRRNAEMADYADCLLAFWDGESKGTKHMIDLAKKKGLKVFIRRYEDAK